MVTTKDSSSVTGNDGIKGCRFGYIRQSDNRLIYHAPYFTYLTLANYVNANYPEQQAWLNDVPYVCDLGDSSFEAYARIHWQGITPYLYPGWYGVVVPPWTAPETGTKLVVDGPQIDEATSKVSWDEESLDVEQPYPVFIIHAQPKSGK
jgi:hypothetical protein